MARGNIVSVTGNLTSDPKVHTFESGTRKATFGLAYNEDRKNDDGTWGTVAHFFEVEVWQGTVTVASKFKKGNLMSVYGRLAWRKWDTDGVQHERVYIIADSVYGEKMYEKGTATVGEPEPAGSASPPRRGRPAAVPDEPAKINEPVDDDIPW